MKKGFELSVNFLVMLILAIAIFSVGIVFLNKINKESQEITNDVDERTQKEILSAMSRSNSKIVIPAVSQTAEKGSSTIFPIGVKNILNETYTFTITATLVEYAKNPTEVYKKVGGSWLGNSPVTTSNEPKAIVAESTFSLAARSEYFTKIGVKVPKDAPKGQYSFDVKTTYMGITGITDYPPALRMYVNVK